MSAPIPMPLPFSNSIVHPVSSVPTPLDTTGSNNLSPSNPSSTQASSIYPSTAGTSPVSGFQIHHHHQPQPTSAGLMVNNPNSVTRILILSEFNKDLKTRDIQLVFSEWEDERGGFKIKWIDDTSCLIVFADPGVAKRAFLSVLSNPPPSLTNPPVTSPEGANLSRVAKLRAYNGPDVMHILASVQNRPRSRSNASQSLHSRASSLASNHNGLSNNAGLGRRPSMGTLAGRHRTSLSAATGVSRNPLTPGMATTTSAAPNSTGPGNGYPLAQVQVQDLIDHVTHPAVGTANSRPSSEHLDDPNPTSRARIDDAGKRFIAAGLGKTNSIISHLPISELDETATSASYSLANLTIEEEVTTPTAASH